MPLRHGLSKTRVYGIWAAMKRRCQNQNCDAYRYYGGRGITVCDRWSSSFLEFLSDMGEPPPGAELERIDNDGNYEPGNCIWASHKSQSRNKRDNLYVTIGKETRSLAAWCDLSGVGYGKAIQRLRAGWAPHHALLCPTLPRQLIFGERPRELAKRAGVSIETVYRRARQGWSKEQICLPPQPNGATRV